MKNAEEKAYDLMTFKMKYEKNNVNKTLCVD